MVRILLCCVVMACCSVALAGEKAKGDANKAKAPVMIKAGDPDVFKGTIKSGSADDGWVVAYKDADGKEQEAKVAADCKTCADCACGKDVAKAKQMKEKYFVKDTPVLVKVNKKSVEMMVFDFAAKKKNK